MTSDNRSFHRSSHLIVSYIDCQNSNHLGRGKGLPLEVLQLEELALDRLLERVRVRPLELALDRLLERVRVGLPEEMVLD